MHKLTFISLLAIMLSFGCVQEKATESDLNYLNLLRPGGDPPDSLVSYIAPDIRINIGHPKNWILTRVTETNPQYGEITIITERGPMDSESNFGYSEIQLFVAKKMSIGGGITNFADFVEKRQSDYLDQGANLPQGNTIVVDGITATKFVLLGSKVVPPVGLSPKQVTTSVTFTLLEKNGFYYDISLSGSKKDHDRFRKVYDNILASIKFL